MDIDARTTDLYSAFNRRYALGPLAISAYGKRAMCLYGNILSNHQHTVPGSKHLNDTLLMLWLASVAGWWPWI